MLLGGVRLVLQLYLPDSECHGSFQCLEGDFAGTQLNFALLLFYLTGTPFLAQIKYSSFRVVLLQLSCKDWSIPMQELPGHLTWCSFHFHCLVPYPGCVNWVPRRGWKWLLGWCPSQAGDTAELCWLRPHQLQPQARADFPNSQQGWARTAPHRITKSQNKRGWKRALRSSSPACDPTPPYQLNRGEALHLNPLRWLSPPRQGGFGGLPEAAWALQWKPGTWEFSLRDHRHLMSHPDLFFCSCTKRCIFSSPQPQITLFSCALASLKVLVFTSDYEKSLARSSLAAVSSLRCRNFFLLGDLAQWNVISDVKVDAEDPPEMGQNFEACGCSLPAGGGTGAECIPEVFRPLAWEGGWERHWCLISGVKFPPLCPCGSKLPGFPLEGSVEPGLFSQHNCSQLLWRRICPHHPWAEEAEIHPSALGSSETPEVQLLSTSLAKNITFFNPQQPCTRPLWFHCTKNVLDILFVFLSQPLFPFVVQIPFPTILPPPK